MQTNAGVFCLKTQTDADRLLASAQHIHMIGIGGSGMHPIAEILHSRGYQLTGSDNNETESLQKIRELGISVKMGHFPENVDGSDLVIYSAAIMQDNPELVSARRQGIPTMERSYALGALTRNFDHVIGVCGTHGKTTVTAMITQILIQSGLDPTAVIGGKLPLTGSYGVVGHSDIMVCESCEYVDTFLKLSPDTCVLLNIDRDHMEYFKTMQRLKQSFTQFANSAKTVLVNGNDENAMDAVRQLDQEIFTFGITADCDYYADHIVYGRKSAGEYDLMYRGERLCHIRVSVPGRHNISNSVAAAAAAYLHGASPEQIAASLLAFRGAGRRFEILDEIGGITVADDYAHHPKELEVTLKAAMDMGYRRVIAVFQPFTYSRTVMLFDDFIRVLQIPDQVVLSEIMGSREINTYHIYSANLCEKLPGAVWFDSFEKIADYVAAHAQPGDLVITLGCGDIYKAARLVIQKLRQTE